MFWDWVSPLWLIPPQRNKWCALRLSFFKSSFDCAWDS